MTSDTTSPPPTAFRATGDLRLLTWPALEASGADAAVTARDVAGQAVAGLAQFSNSEKGMKRTVSPALIA